MVTSKRWSLYTEFCSHNTTVWLWLVKTKYLHGKYKRVFDILIKCSHYLFLPHSWDFFENLMWFMEHFTLCTNHLQFDSQSLTEFVPYLLKFRGAHFQTTPVKKQQAGIAEVIEEALLSRYWPHSQMSHAESCARGSAVVILSMYDGNHPISPHSTSTDL